MKRTPSSPKSQIELTKLYQRLDYDPITGLFFRKHYIDKMGRMRNVSGLAGKIDVHGYVLISIDGTVYRAHRLAWYYMTKEWPTEADEIDHINGVKIDNRFNNLRICTSAQNGWNCKNIKTNTSGFKGVSFHKKSNKWTAYIIHNNVYRYLGVYSSKEEAILIREATERDLYGEFSSIDRRYNKEI